MNSIRSYALVTGAYWGFTITDGALRMLVVLHFYKLGYDSISIAFLFLFYEFFGIVTNLFGGWIASRSGVKVTLYGGLALQIFALLMLALLNPRWSEVVSVAYVMAAQALSGIAKDLTKMSAKSAIKVIVPEGADGALFKWVARLTGSKNALKGVGFFVGGALLAAFGFVGALVGMAVALVVVLLATVASLSGDLGRSKKKVKFASILSKSPEINWLSAARLFLFASRDVWFVVGLPVFLSQLGWSSYAVGAFLAAWVIGYGFIQAGVPELLHAFGRRDSIDGTTARQWAFVLFFVPFGLIGALWLGFDPGLTLLVGLAVFAVVFAINSAVHSYLVLAYTDEDSVALNVGFYYMANAAGRLLGTLLSGVVFQFGGFQGCLWGSAALVLAAAVLSLRLPSGHAVSLATVGGSRWRITKRENFRPHTRRLKMNSIQVFDPALCCSTGVCGVDVDQALVRFSSDVAWAKQNGAQIERFNLAQQPMAFAQNGTIKGFLERSGAEALPVVLVNGEVALAGRYPNRAELARWAGILPIAVETKSAGSCCAGDKCC